MATQQEILDVLRRARERIADPARWCRRSMAVDEEGCSVQDGRWGGAIAWCAVGALQAETPAEGTLCDEALGYVAAASWRQLGLPVTKVNDTEGGLLGHAAVLALYDRAIADAAAAVLA